MINSVSKYEIKGFNFSQKWCILKEFDMYNINLVPELYQAFFFV